MGALAAGPVFGQVAVATVTMDAAYGAALQARIGLPGTFATGDLNGDGAVDSADQPDSVCLIKPKTSE